MKKEGPAPLGYASHCVEGNQWVKVGLSKDEIHALKQVAADLSLGKSPVASAVWWLTRFALAHYDEVLEKMCDLYDKAGGDGWGINAEIKKAILAQMKALNAPPVEHVPGRPLPVIDARLTETGVLEPELFDIAAHLSPGEMLEMASTMARQVEQLRQAAIGSTFHPVNVGHN